MKCFIVILAAAVVALATPAYAESDNTNQPTLAASSPFSPEAIAQAVAAVQSQQATDAKLAQLDERIVKARKRISAGKQNTVLGAVLLPVGMYLLNRGETFYGAIVTVPGVAGVVAGPIWWSIGKRDLRRAEAERRELTNPAVASTSSVAVGYRIHW